MLGLRSNYGWSWSRLRARDSRRDRIPAKPQSRSIDQLSQRRARRLPRRGTLGRQIDRVCKGTCERNKVSLPADRYRLRVYRHTCRLCSGTWRDCRGHGTLHTPIHGFQKELKSLGCFIELAEIIKIAGATRPALIVYMVNSEGSPQQKS